MILNYRTKKKRGTGDLSIDFGTGCSTLLSPRLPGLARSLLVLMKNSDILTRFA